MGLAPWQAALLIFAMVGGPCLLNIALIIADKRGRRQ